MPTEEGNKDDLDDNVSKYSTQGGEGEMRY